MPWPFRRKKPKEPTYKDQLREQSKREMIVQEGLTDEMAKDGIEFDFQVIDDEKILMLFNRESDLYCPLVLPLLPLVSRLNYLSNCSLHEARVFKLNVDCMIARLKNRAESVEEYMLLDGLRTWFHMRINDSVEGFKIRVLTTREKRITLREEETQKKGWFR